MNRRVVVVVMVTAVLLAGFRWLGHVSAAAQNPSPDSRAQQSPSMPDLMKMHEQMMAEMAAGNAKLDVLVKEMNAASGDAKVTAMAAVVTELVRQRRSMHDRIGEVHHQMMGGRGRMMNR